MAGVRQEHVQIVLEASTNKYKDELDNLTRKQKVLTDQLKEMRKGTQEYADTAKDLRQVTDKIGELQKEIGTAGLTMKQLESLSKQLNAQLKNTVPGTEEWESLSAKVREVDTRMKALRSAANGGAVAEQLKPIKKEADLAGLSIAQLEKLLEKMKSDLKNMDPDSAGFKQLGQEAQIVEGRLLGLKKATGSFRDELSILVPGFSHFQDFSTRLGSGTNAMKLLTGSTNAFKVALASTGIGLVVIALGALYVWVQKTDDGMKFLEGSMNAISNVADVLVNRFLKLAKLDFKGAFGGMGKDLKQATDAGYETADAVDKLDEETRKLTATNVRLKGEIDQLMLRAKNRTLAESERQELLEKAAKKEEERYKNEVRLSQMGLDNWAKVVADKYRRANDANDLIAKSDEELVLSIIQGQRKVQAGTVKDDELNKFMELYSKKQEVLNDDTSFKERVNTLRDRLDLQQEKKDDAAQKRAEKRAQQQKALQDKILKDKEDAHKLDSEMDRERLQGLDAILKGFDIELEAREKQIQGYAISEAEKTRLIDEARKNRDEKALAAWDQNAQELEQKQNEQDEKDLADAEKKAEEEIEIAYRKAKAIAEIEHRAAENNGDLDGVINAKLKLHDLEQAHLIATSKFTQEELTNAAEAGAEERKAIVSNEVSAYIEKFIEAAQRIVSAWSGLNNDLNALDRANMDKALAEKEREKQARLKKLEEEFSRGKISKEKYEKDKAVIEGQYTAQSEELRKKQAETERRRAKQEIYANLAIEIARYFSSVLSTGTFGVQGAILAGIATARALTQIATLDAQKFATGGTIDPRRGGMVLGSSHAHGGILLYDRGRNSILGEIEGGEELRIYRKDLSDVARYHLDMASFTQGNHTKFATGGVVNGDGPTVDLGNAEVVQVLRRIEDKIEDWPTRLEVINYLSETEAGLEKRKKVQNDAAF